MKPTISHRLEFAFTWLLSLVLRCVPRRLRGAFGAGLGQIIYFIGIRRKVTEQNLARAFPSLAPKAVRQVARRVYRHFGTVATAYVSLPRLGRSNLGKWIFLEGEEVLQQCVAEGRGGLFFSGHLGNWEIMGSIAAAIGYPVTFVVARQSNSLVEEFIDRYRQAAGVEIVKRRDAVRGVLTALKQNRLVAILIDQDAHEDGAFVPFFGRLASTPRGPAVFHLRTGAPLIFAHSVRLPGERYEVRISRFDPQGETDSDKLTAQMTALLEAAIRKTPEQWFWMHRRWKTLPPESSS